MTMTFTSTDLQAAVAWVVQRLPKASISLSGSAVIIDPPVDGHLPLVAADGGDDARALAPVASGTGEGMTRTGVPGHALASAVQACRGKDISLEFEDNAVLVRSAGAKFQLPIVDLATHPMGGSDTMAGLPPSQFSLTGEQLHWVVRTISPAASKDLATPALTGIKLITGGGKLKAAALDRMILAAVEMPLEDAPDFSALIPASVLRSTIGHIPKDVEKVNFRWDGDEPSKVYISFPGRAIALGLLSGKDMFPDFEAVIKPLAKSDSAFVTDTGDLREAIKQAKAVADEESTLVTFITGDDGITVKAKGTVFQYTGTFDASKVGDDTAVSMSLGRLADAVGNLNGDLMVVAHTGNALRLTATDVGDDDEYGDDFLGEIDASEGAKAAYVLVCHPA